MIEIIIVVSLFFISFYLLMKWLNRIKKKKDALRDLTGKYRTLKGVNSDKQLRVQYTNEDGKLRYRPATNYDIKVLTKYKYIK